jgi:ABC-type transporter Mla subunit MlaD
MSDTMSDTLSDTLSDTSDTLSDTLSDTSDTSNASDTISNELQQDLQEALAQCISIKHIHDNILEEIDRLKENIADTIYVVDGQNKQDLNIILDDLYQNALQQIETTGHNPFGRMLLSILDKTEFKYSTSTL